MPLVKFLRTKKTTRKLIYKLGEPRARSLIRRIEAYLSPRDEIVDIGSGIGNICIQLRGRGHKVTPVDIQDLCFAKGAKPILYDGKKLPFSDKSFDVALIITVLHHTKDQLLILSEAKRLAAKVIVIEDIYINLLHKYLVFFVDSLLNLEFKGHPHSNLSDLEWKRIFKKCGFKINLARYDWSFIVMKQAVYVLEP